MTKPDQEEIYSEVETEARREVALKRMVATPHQKHKPLGASARRPPGKIS